MARQIINMTKISPLHEITIIIIEWTVKQNKLFYEGKTNVFVHKMAENCIPVKVQKVQLMDGPSGR